MTLTSSEIPGLGGPDGEPSLAADAIPVSPAVEVGPEIPPELASDADAEGPAATATATAGARPRKRGRAGKTAAGRAASARNSTQHGMRAKNLFPIELEPLLQERILSATQRYRPTNQGERDAVLEIARGEVQIEQANAYKLLDVARIKYRARFAWDDDRNKYVDQLAKGLNKDCHRVVRALKRTKHGVEFLLDCWEELELIVQEQGTLDEAQWQAVFTLLGIPPEFRAGNPRVPADDDGPGLAALIDEEANALARLLDESLIGLDEFHRSCALDGYAFEADAETRLIRRYEADAYRRRDRAVAALMKLRSEGVGATPEPAAGAPSAPGAPAASPPTSQPAPAGPPDLPPRPVQSEADRGYLFGLSVETATDLAIAQYKLARAAEAEAEPETRTEADPVAAGPSEPAVAVPAPAADDDATPVPAAPATLSKHQQKKREYEQRFHQRAAEERARKGKRKKR